MHHCLKFPFAAIAASLICLATLASLALAEEDKALVGDVNEAGKPQVELKRDIVFGTAAGEDLRLDLAAPKGLNQPAAGIIWIHGGAWRGGDKREFERLLIDSAQKGYVAVNINYRLVPKHAFPAQVEDCKCAVRWFRSQAEALHLDPQRIGVVGSSAGAHLAMMLGAMGPNDGLEGDGGSPGVSSRVRAVVSFAGPTNLESPFPVASKQLVADFLGPAPSADARRRASPISYVTADDPPMLLFQGTKDPLVPHDQAMQMTEALTKAGVPGRVELMIGQGHGWPQEHARVIRATFEFLEQRLQSPRSGP